MKVVVNNIDKEKDSDLRERVRNTMVKQIRKKFYEDGLRKLRCTGGVENDCTKGVDKLQGC